MSDNLTTPAPKVSVILPVYNVEPYIAKCLSSLMAQTMQELEFILVDDCGSDRSIDIAREYAARDSRFRILEGIENMGSGASRNRGLEVARGEYIGFVDPDDWVTPDYFQQLYETAVAEQADVVKGRLIRIGDAIASEALLNARIRECINSSRWPGLVFTYCFASALYRTELIRRHHISFPPLRNGEDTMFLVSYLIHAKSVALNDMAIYFYFQRMSSATHVVNDEFYEAVFRNAEMRGELINHSELPETDITLYWDFIIHKYVFEYLLGHVGKASRDFYINFFTRIQAIFLNSGQAQKLCDFRPKVTIYRELLEKTPEEIVDARLDILPKLERPAAVSRPKVSPAKPMAPAPQTKASPVQKTIAPPKKKGAAAPAASAPLLAACAWRYPVYLRRYRYCQFMALFTIGKRRRHYKNKREAYRRLLRDIRRTTQQVTNRRNLPW